VAIESEGLRRWREENIPACSFCGRRDYDGAMENEVSGATICDKCVVEFYEDMIFGGEPDPRLPDDDIDPDGPGIRDPRKPRPPDPGAASATPVDRPR